MYKRQVNPVEIAYFDRGPIDDEDLVVGGFWSTYWYNGRIYATEIVRGLDVLALVPSEHLSENEIAAAAAADYGGAFNPQQQFRVDWPAEPVVAHAYIDQLVRSWRHDDGVVIMVMHDVNLAMRFSDHLLLLFGEGETHHGNAVDLATEENFSRLYGHPLRRYPANGQHFFVPV